MYDSYFKYSESLMLRLSISFKTNGTSFSAFVSSKDSEIFPNKYENKKTPIIIIRPSFIIFLVSSQINKSYYNLSRVKYNCFK